MSVNVELSNLMEQFTLEFKDVERCNFRINQNGDVIFDFANKIPSFKDYQVEEVKEVARIRTFHIKITYDDPTSEERNVHANFIYYELDDQTLVQNLSFEVISMD
jgi:hypothetical protein